MAHGGKIPGPSSVLWSVCENPLVQILTFVGGGQLADPLQTFSPELFTDGRLNAVHVSVDQIQMFSIGEELGTVAWEMGCAGK